MDHSKETLSLEVLYAESEKNPIISPITTSELSSWIYIKYPSSKTSEIPSEVPKIPSPTLTLLSSPPKTMHLRKNHLTFPSPKFSTIKTPKKASSPISFQHKISDINLNNTENNLSKTHKLSYDMIKIDKSKNQPKSIENKVYKKRNLTEIDELAQKIIMPEVPLMTKYVNHLNNNIAKRYKVKKHKNEKVLTPAKQKIYIKKVIKLMSFLDEKNKKHDISDGLLEIIRESRSSSPNARVSTSGWQNKRPIYTARTLEELLLNSKLPDIRSNSFKLKSKKNYRISTGII
ncbi:hypothetical protein SteCoe_13221 [Stentor coeruleus]|uniref:Uncharacterized protein n=1 Tax=Stentor coeruleus TaxID=5963 RepID=A0A1R2C8Z8_9CILI|nr:hypothetical protein SteCoe_13221 [Stentor coeruleus]